MNTVSSITLNGHKKEKQNARELLAVGYDPLARAKGNIELLKKLSETTIGSLDRKVKHGIDLSFEEAFCGMCYVVAATNASFKFAHHSLFETACGGTFTKDRSLALASAFINLMAAKESFKYLTHEEIAGMVSAAMMDSVIQIKIPRVIETCGMGGDKGYGAGFSIKKGINTSTLASLVLSAVGLPAIKHGSYGNTSVVGSTEAIELFGVFTSMTSEEEVMRIMNTAGYCFFDAHWCKTIHDLSHLLMMETVNHIIGPMTPPLSPLTEINKLMGVNEKVHPETIVKAYALLHELGIQNVGGVVVVAGLSESGIGIDPKNYDVVRQYTILDELSPYASVVSVGFESKHMGTFIMTPEDFGIEVDPRRIEFENNQKVICRANIAALHGTDPALVDYLAMNSALGLFAFEYAGKADVVVDGKLNRSYLRECFFRCHKVITNGRARDVLANYVKVSRGESLLALV